MEAQRLLDVTRESLHLGIQAAQAGAFLGNADQVAAGALEVHDAVVAQVVTAVAEV